MWSVGGETVPVQAGSEVQEAIDTYSVSPGVLGHTCEPAYVAWFSTDAGGVPSGVDWEGIPASVVAADEFGTVVILDAAEPPRCA